MKTKFGAVLAVATIVASAGAARAQTPAPAAPVEEHTYDPGKDQVEVTCGLGSTCVVETLAPQPASQTTVINRGFGRVGLEVDVNGQTNGTFFSRQDLFASLGLTLVLRLGDVGRWSLAIRAGEGYGGTVNGPTILLGIPIYRHEHSLSLGLIREVSEKFAVGPILGFANEGGLLEPSWGFRGKVGVEFDFRVSRRWTVVVTPQVGLDGAADNKGGFVLALGAELDLGVKLTLF